MAGNEFEADKFASWKSLSLGDMRSILPRVPGIDDEVDDEDDDDDVVLEKFVTYCQSATPKPKFGGFLKFFGDRGATPKFPNVKALFLERIRLRDRGLRALVSFLEAGYVSGLRELNINVELELDEGEKVAEEFFRKIFKSGSLKDLTNLKLQCWTSSVEDRSGLVNSVHEALVKSLENGCLRKLKSLKLARECKLSAEALRESTIVRLLKAFQSDRYPARELEILDLSCNEIGDTAAKVLAAAFDSGNLSKLGDLRLKGNHIGTEGATAIFQSFGAGKCPKVYCLDLSDNKFDDDGNHLLALAKALESGHLFYLKHCSLLSTRFYGQGPLHSVGMKEISHALGACPLPNLEKLIIYSDASQIPTDVKDNLVESYRKKPSLTAPVWNSVSNSPETLVERELIELQHGNEERMERMKLLQGEEDVSGEHGKVFFCGHPGVGKTTLRKTITKYKAAQGLGAGLCCWSSPQEVEEPARTRGIEMARIQSKRVQLVLWDLAGQHEYEVLHSAFLPDLDFANGQVTFFVIVCKANDFNKARDDLYHWLKFISSNSVEGITEDRKRRVFVIPNCFHGKRDGIRIGDGRHWNHLLTTCQKVFGKVLNLQTTPLIMDVTCDSDVRAFREKILAEAQQVLQMRKMPRICRTVEESGMQWVKGNEHYPVLAWEAYRQIVGPSCPHEKLAAAAEYLHDAGLIILVKRSDTSLISDGAASTSRTTQDDLVIVDPQWFCQKVVGNLLLPGDMRQQDEDNLRYFMHKERGSLPISVLKNRMLDVPSDKCDEAIELLSHFGICYRLPDRADAIFVPDLITNTVLPAPGWSKETWKCDAGAWVIGFALKVKNEKDAFLPIAALRHLQVDLALDKDVGSKHDSDYLATRYAISFKYNHMLVLIEYSEVGQDRTDVLVRPLRSVDTLARNAQVNVAQEFVTRILHIVRDRCRHVELQKQIVKPWSGDEGPQSMELRDIDVSVEELKEQVERSGGLRTMEWTVGSKRVEQADVLSDDDLSTLLGDTFKRVALTKEAVQWLTSNPSNITESDGSRGKQSKQETPEVDFTPDNLNVSDPDLVKLFQALTCHHSKVSMEILQKQDDCKANLVELRADVNRGISKITESQKPLNLRIQNLEKFSVQEKESSVPRFAFLTHKESSKWLVNLKLVKEETIVLHFLCEANVDTGTFHEVENQKGIEIKRFRDWIKKLRPVLVWTLKVTFVASKIAGNVALPGLGILFSDGPINNLCQRLVEMTPGAAESSKYLFEKLNDAFEQTLSCTSIEAGRGERVSKHGSGSELELRGDSRAAIRQLLYRDGMNGAERNRLLGLRRVCLKDTDSDEGMQIRWICNTCYNRYNAYRDRAYEF